MKRKIAAILAADVEGYSRLVSEDEEEALRRLAVYRAVFDDFIAKAGGRIFNTAGDAVLAEFSSAVEATRCAIDVQESLRTRNLAYQPSRHMLFRIGLTIGDVVEREGDLLGDGVNVAARLQGLAAPGGICVSRSVYEQVAGKISVPFRDIGEQEVKNIAHPVHAFMVQMSGDTPVRGKPRQRYAGAPARQNNLTLVLSGAAAAFAFAALGVAMGPLLWRDRVAPSRPRPQAQHQARPAIPSTASPAEAFAILAKTGLLSDPKTVPELYHNARVHEARGEPAAARRDYDALAALGTDAVDPLYRFAGLLRGQGGRAGARDVFAGLAKKTRASALVYALQFEPRERRKRLQAFVAANPDFGPAHYLLAREFSADKVGDQTLYDKRMEFEGLDRFLDLDRSGKLAAYFIDGSMVAEWLDRARRAHAVLNAMRQTTASAPTATYSRAAGGGWAVSLNLPEAATKVSYRLGDQGQFIATGTLADIDPRSGKAVPRTTFDLPKGIGVTVIEVTYEDMSGNLQGPFKLHFDPLRALIRDQRETLDRFWTMWIAFRTGAGKEDLVSYTQLVSHRCAISKAEFGFDDGPLARTLPLPKCEDGDPEAVPQNAIASFPMPRGAKSISVQLTYTDGSRSDTRAFKHP